MHSGKQKKALASAFITQLLVSSGIKKKLFIVPGLEMLDSTDVKGVVAGQVYINDPG